MTIRNLEDLSYFTDVCVGFFRTITIISEFKISGNWDFFLREADQKKEIEEEKQENNGKWEVIINHSAMSHSPLLSRQAQ